MNAFIERWIQSIKHEVLNHFIICGEEHFNHLISEYQEYYHTARPHQGMGNMPLTGSYAAKGDEVFDLGEIECRHRLGGLLKDYFHRAA
jgi:putative transposase